MENSNATQKVVFFLFALSTEKQTDCSRLPPLHPTNRRTTHIDIPSRNHNDPSNSIHKNNTYKNCANGTAHLDPYVYACSLGRLDTNGALAVRHHEDEQGRN